MAELLTRAGPKAAPQVAAPARAQATTPAAPKQNHPPRVTTRAPSPAAPASQAEPKASVHDRLKAFLSAPADVSPSSAGPEEGDTDGGVAPSLGEGHSQDQSETSSAPQAEEVEAVPAQA